MRKSFLIILLATQTFVHGYSRGIDQSVSAVAKQVKTVKTKDATLDQKLKAVKDNIVELDIITTDIKGHVSNEVYHFNLADINAVAVREVVAGRVMFVEVPIKDNTKYVQYNREGKFYSYNSNCRIAVDDIDNSRALIAALKTAVESAEKIEMTKYSYSSRDQIIAALIKAVKPNVDNTIVQSITSSPEKKEKLSFTIQRDGKNLMYEFNLSDLNPNRILVSVGARGTSIHFETLGNQRLIKVFENGAPKSYSPDFTIYPADIENTKQIKNLFYLAIQNLKSGTTSLSSTK